MLTFEPDLKIISRDFRGSLTLSHTNHQSNSTALTRNPDLKQQIPPSKHNTILAVKQIPNHAELS